MTAPDQIGSDANRPDLLGCSIRSCVELRLRRSGYAALGLVYFEFETESGVLHLRGAVPSYYLKQLAQELVCNLEGVLLVKNQIKVTRPSTTNKM